MKILLTGGGTAGHINPALAIADIFRQNNKEAEIIFAGTEHGMERRLVKEKDYPYYPISVRGFSRSLHPKNLYALYLAAISPIKAKKILRELAPSLVVGTGGYVSWPMLRAASKLGIPTAIHESNAIPGLTVRRLAGDVDLVLLNFREAEEKLKKAKKLLVVGNPLRSGFSFHSRKEAKEKLGIPGDAKLVLSFGGSLGAESINRAVLSLWGSYTLKKPNVYHIHGTGQRLFSKFSEEAERYAPLPPRIRILPYLTDMPTLMSAADLVISRSGAITLSELARAHRASLLIPSPYVAEDHQTKNAETMEKAGAALLLREKDITPETVRQAVAKVIEHPDTQAKMEQAAVLCDFPDANQKIYRALLSLIRKTATP